MTFWYKYINKDKYKNFSGKPVMVSDTSLLFEPRPDDINFSVLLAGNWRYSLEMNAKTKRCIAFTGFFDELECELADLDILNSQKGELFFNDDMIEFMSGCGCHYKDFTDKCYVDINKNTIYIGKINSSGNLVEFAKDTFAVINDSCLGGIFIKISNDLKRFLKTYKRKNKVAFNHINNEEG